MSDNNRAHYLAETVSRAIEHGKTYALAPSSRHATAVLYLRAAERLERDAGDYWQAGLVRLVIVATSLGVPLHTLLENLREEERQADAGRA